MTTWMKLTVITSYSSTMSHRLELAHLQRFNGNVHVLMEFLDQCDWVTSLLWYQGQDPFAHHDFFQNNSKPRTCNKAKTSAKYAKLTL